MQHFSGSIQKRTADGEIVISTYLDDGEELVTSSPTAKTVETTEDYPDPANPGAFVPVVEEFVPLPGQVMGQSAANPWATTGDGNEVLGGMAEASPEVEAPAEPEPPASGEPDPNSIIGDSAPTGVAPSEDDSESGDGTKLTTDESGSSTVVVDEGEKTDAAGENAAPDETGEGAGGDGGVSDEVADEPSTDWTHDQLNSYAAGLTPPLELTGSSPNKADKVQMIADHVKVNAG